MGYFREPHIHSKNKIEVDMICTQDQGCEVRSQTLFGKNSDLRVISSGIPIFHRAYF